MKALVVDDSKAMRMIIGRTLQELQFEVVEAVDGVKALELLEKEGGPDLILVDWNMPEMDGLEFVRALRGNPKWSSVPVVMVTSETELERVSKALEAGADEYVMKPFTREVLQEKLQLLGLIE